MDLVQERPCAGWFLDLVDVMLCSTSVEQFSLPLQEILSVGNHAGCGTRKSSSVWMLDAFLSTSYGITRTMRMHDFNSERSLKDCTAGTNISKLWIFLNALRKLVIWLSGRKLSSSAKAGWNFSFSSFSRKCWLQNVQFQHEATIYINWIVEFL
jgi:hypothetical protein